MKKIILLGALLLLGACADSDNDAPAAPFDPAVPDAPQVTPPEPELNASFDISITNQTLGQPFSPVAVLIHDQSAQAFAVGQPASEGLEVLAESGDNSQLLAAIDSAAETSGAAPVGPGASDSFTLELPGSDTSGMALTVVTMLVNTNDAITAVNSASIADLAVGDSLSFATLSYDAGTEANTEAGTEIPGPAGGGEGFNANRDDIRDQVTQSAGVVTADDGLTDSALGQQHRWDNPVARVSITRTQ